ncbi:MULTISPECIES: hypothetical protein [Gordonia]|uniref:hypothetical protein n=1 Tax=Gordonia TaxID=2053 RepID=UPI0038D3C4AC
MLTKTRRRTFAVHSVAKAGSGGGGEMVSMVGRSCLTQRVCASFFFVAHVARQEMTRTHQLSLWN